MPDDLARRLWRRRVDRALGPSAWRKPYDASRRETARKQSDAARDYLAKHVTLDGGALELDADAKAKASRDYMDELGRISGAGPGRCRECDDDLC